MGGVMMEIILLAMVVIKIAIFRMGMFVLITLLTLLACLESQYVSSSKNSQSPTYTLKGRLAQMPLRWLFR